MENKKEFHEGQYINVVWEHDGLLQRHEGKVMIKVNDLGFFGDDNKDEWLVEIIDREDTYRMIQVWDEEMFEIKEVQ